MAFINDAALDAALDLVRNNADALHITSQEVTAYANVATYTLGNKANPTVSAPGDRTPNGRKVTVSAISDGSVTGTGTATHWCLVDVDNTRVTASGALSASQAVTSGNTFTLTSFDIGIPDAA